MQIAIRFIPQSSNVQYAEWLRHQQEEYIQMSLREWVIKDEEDRWGK